VYAGARDPQTVVATDPRVVPVQLDVTDHDSVYAAAALAGDVDLLVNNAGISDGTSVFGPDGVDSLRRQLETNTLGPLQMTRAFAPALEANGGGAVVNMLSVLSWVTFPSTSAYSASKAAAWSVTNASRGELRAQGTQVVGVHVGYLDTDMAAHVDGPKTDPADLARQVLDAVEAGADEVLGDDLSRGVKAGLSGSVAQLSA
jgi:NAD(P)-dependent dehydrogenase (short-subunit alcohol dehydrogenase family)